MKQTVTRLLPWAASWLLGMSSTQAQVGPAQRPLTRSPFPATLAFPAGARPLQQALPGERPTTSARSLAKRLAPATAAPQRLPDPATTPSAALRTTARTSASVSEAWVARYAGAGNSYDGAADVAIDAAGSVYVTGFSLGITGGYDYVTVKYNINGAQLWEVRYNGPANSDDVPTSLAVDGAGNVYVTGSSVGTGTRYDYATVKYSPDGQQRWVARYSGPANNEDLAASLAVDAAGNVAVTGASYNGSGSSYDYLTVKYGSTGQQLWEARYNGPASSDDLPTTLALDGAGNVYVTGTSYSSSQSDYATLKYDASGGQLQWQAFYNGPGNNYDLVRELAVDATGRVAVTGLSFNGSSYDYATASYSAAGQPQWSAVYNGAGNGYDEATGVALDGTGNVLVTGYAETSGGNWDYTTFKYAAADGQPVWEARYNGPDGGYDEAQDVAVDASGNVLVTGRSFTGLGQSEYATVKYAASSGQPVWATRAQGVGSSDQQATGIAVNAAGTVAVTGTATRSTTDSNYATLTYAASGQTRWRAEGPAITNADSEASDLAVDAAGNVFVTGLIYAGSARWELLTVKYAANGQLVWQARYPAEVVTGRLPHIAVDAAGNVTVAGTIYSSSFSDCLILKYEGATGRQQWARTYNGTGNGGDGVADVAVDPAGNVVVTGNSAGSNSGNDFVTLKYAASGQLLWIARYFLVGDEDDLPAAVALDAAGNVYVTGYGDGDESFVLNYDYVTLKYSPTGQQLWVARYRGTGARDSEEEARDLAVDAFGNVAVTGRSYTSSGSSAFATVKYNGTSGEQLWATRFEAYGFRIQQHGATGIATDAAGDVVVTGVFSTSDGQSDYATLKYGGTSGQQLWLVRYDGPINGNDQATDVVLDAAGDVYVSGSSVGGPSASPNALFNMDYATLKYAGSSGEQLWVARYNGPANGYDLATAFAVDALGRVVVTGRSESGLSFGQQFATVAYTQSSPATAKVLRVATPSTAASPARGQQLAVYPNPTTGPTTIGFRPVLDGPAQVLVYNQLGQQVATLYDGPVRQGHSYEWSLRSEQLPAGLYTCSLLVSGQRESVRLLVTH